MTNNPASRRVVRARLRRLVAAIPPRGGYLFYGAYVAFTFFAFAWVLSTSLRTNQQLFADVWGIPSGDGVSNFPNVWTNSGLGLAFLNSVIAAVGGSALAVGLAAPAAYVLSRASFRGRDIITNVFAAGMGVPAALLIIPMYLMMNQMGLTSSVTGLLIVYVAISLPFTMLILTAFFATLPVELEEAAVIDGASEWRVFRSVMLPLAQPGVLTALIFNFVFLWKEFFWGLVLLQSRDSRTLAVALNGLRESLAFSANWVGMFAAVVIVMVPALVVYIVLSRRVLGAVTLGAVKQ